MADLEQGVSDGSTDVRPRASANSQRHGGDRAAAWRPAGPGRARRRAPRGDPVHRRDRLGPPGRELLPVSPQGKRDPRRRLLRMDTWDDKTTGEKRSKIKVAGRSRPVPRLATRRRAGDGGPAADDETVGSSGRRASQGPARHWRRLRVLPSPACPGQRLRRRAPARSGEAVSRRIRPTTEPSAVSEPDGAANDRTD